MSVDYITTGWKPSCSCPQASSLKPQACMVLDPFSGSGTTGVAAVKNGCDFLGFETNPEYHEKSNERLQAAREGLTLHEKKSGQTSLFIEAK